MNAAKAHNTTLFSGLKQAVQIDILHPVTGAVCALDPCARLSPPAGNFAVCFWCFITDRPRHLVTPTTRRGIHEFA